MTVEAVTLFVLVAVAIGYVAGRVDRIDLGPMRRIGQGPDAGDPEPRASAPQPRRDGPRGSTGLRLGGRRGAGQPRERVTPISGRPPERDPRERD